MANTPCPAPPAATRLACTSAFFVAGFISVSLQQLAVSQRIHDIIHSHSTHLAIKHTTTKQKECSPNHSLLLQILLPLLFDQPLEINACTRSNARDHQCARAWLCIPDSSFSGAAACSSMASSAATPNVSKSSPLPCWLVLWLLRADWPACATRQSATS